MIWIWNNGGEYSDYCIFFIETSLPRESFEGLLPTGGKLEGCAAHITWFEGGAGKLSDVVEGSSWFKRVYLPVPPGVEELYVGGGPKGEEHAKRHARASWEAGKYKKPWNDQFEQFWTENPGYYPKEEMFKALTPACAAELLQHYREPWASWFKQECIERGLITEDS